MGLQGGAEDLQTFSSSELILSTCKVAILTILSLSLSDNISLIRYYHMIDLILITSVILNVIGYHRSSDIMFITIIITITITTILNIIIIIIIVVIIIINVIMLRVTMIIITVKKAMQASLETNFTLF